MRRDRNFHTNPAFFWGVALLWISSFIRHVLELLPFASMQNVPLRIYSGDLTGACMWQAVFLQVFWLAALTLAGEFLNMLAMKRITVQGG